MRPPCKVACQFSCQCSKSFMLSQEGIHLVKAHAGQSSKHLWYGYDEYGVSALSRLYENLAVLTVLASVFMAQGHLASVSTDPCGLTGALRAQVRCYSVDFILGAWGSLEAKLPLSSASLIRVTEERLFMWLHLRGSPFPHHILPTIKLRMNNTHTHTHSPVSYCERALWELIVYSCSINPNYFDCFHAVMKYLADSIVWISGILIDGAKCLRPSVKNAFIWHFSKWIQFVLV